METLNSIDSGGVRIGVKVEGAENAPWLILSNSLGADMSMWNPQIDALARHFRVLRYDTRGHGASDVPDGPYDFGQFTGDVIASMDSLGIESADFMGLSLGGMTGMGLAIHYPGRIRRLVVADARADAPQAVQNMWDERIAKVRDGGLEAIVEGTLESWVSQKRREEDADLVKEIRRMVLANDPAGYIATCYGLKKLDYLPFLHKIKCPALFVGGGEDMGAAPDVMKDMAGRTPSGGHATIEGARHLSNLDKPDVFAETVISFLRSLP